MAKTGVLCALGLMSGTSLDGIDAALLWTDGESVERAGPWRTEPYHDGLRERLRAVLGGRGDVEGVARDLTDAHADAVEHLLHDADVQPHEVDVIGFHGHTILHEPDAGRTWQIGDGRRLAAATGIDVVADFRSADMAAGGQGAPLAPLYHRALSRDLTAPVAMLNVGGVANVTWIGGNGDGDILAFDTGPGNAMIDDWVRRGTGGAMDGDGALARSGTVDAAALRALLDHRYFSQRPPKSLDRDDFSAAPVAGLSPADGAATLTRFTVATVARGAEHFPTPARRWLVTGGGRHNAFLMESLGQALGVPVEPVEAAGWNGDALEAQAFAFLAVRSLRGLPLSVPGTTGVAAPTTGGVVNRAPGLGRREGDPAHPAG